MKDAFPLYVVVVAVLALAVTVFFAGASVGERGERDRHYTKCLKEHEVLAYKDAVGLCKERMK